MVPDQVHRLGNLVDVTAAVVVPSTPLMAVDRTQFTCLIVSPCIPDVDILFLKGLLVGVAGEEPEKFLDDSSRKHLLCGQQREPFAQVVSALCAEYALRADTGPVGLDGTVVEDVTKYVEILFHYVLAYRVENDQMIASWKVSPGSRTVVG